MKIRRLMFFVFLGFIESASHTFTTTVFTGYHTNDEKERFLGKRAGMFGPPNPKQKALAKIKSHPLRTTIEACR
jgi:hypothetical protein